MTQYVKVMCLNNKYIVAASPFWAANRTLQSLENFNRLALALKLSTTYEGCYERNFLPIGVLCVQQSELRSH